VCQQLKADSAFDISQSELRSMLGGCGKAGASAGLDSVQVRIANPKGKEPQQGLCERGPSQFRLWMQVITILAGALSRCSPPALPAHALLEAADLTCEVWAQLVWLGDVCSAALRYGLH
jgi:hypothetical protein